MSKKATKAKKSGHSRSQGSRRWLYFTVAVGLVGVIVLVAGLTVGSSSPQVGDSVTTDTSLPRWLSRSPAVVREGYAYAAQHPETLSYIPCYCGCGVHSGHKSAYNCFFASDTGDKLVYDQHGLNCAMCLDIALMTKKMLAQGRSLAEVKAAVDQKYSSLGPPTDTPPLPQG